ncbi:MAG: hypothetical protein J6T10_01670 [Methanobrevibacter sp.]|nr:hypothetical protein [Methanobrevibacter sp.]
MKGIDTIYLDMDGCIVDFRKGCEELDAIEGYKVDWEKVHANGIDFWANLPWTPEGERFYKWLEKYCDEQGIDLCILSQVNYDEGVQGKYEWLMNNTRVPNKNIYIVKTGKAKAKYASNSSLLIDDFGKNIESFVMAGGKGIKFESPGQVRQELMKL